MKRVLFLSFCILVVSVSVNAAPVPELLPADSPLIPPPIKAAFPVQETIPPVPPQNPTKQEILDSIKNMSSFAYLSVVKDWGLEAQLASKAQSREIKSLAQTQVTPWVSATSVLGSVNASNDSAQDAEPSIIAIDRGGTVYTTTAFIKLVNGIPLNHFSTTTDFATFTRGQLPMPSGYQKSADPLLAANPYTTGIAPGRVYLTGIVYNPHPPGAYGVPNGIAVWRSDDGGMNWSQPTIAAVSNSSTYYLDKPAIVVSWHGGSLGYVYVAYTRFVVGGAKELYVVRSTDGGITFGTPVFVTSGNINGAQILVNGFNGVEISGMTDNGLTMPAYSMKFGKS